MRLPFPPAAPARAAAVRSPTISTVVTLAVAGLLAACGEGGDSSRDGGAGLDGGVDAGDAGRPPRDGGPLCEPGCVAPAACCAGAEGAPNLCVDTRSSLAHCGGCGLACGERFTACLGGVCFCGDTACNAPSACCPSATPGGPPSCRSLSTIDDCNACGAACDRDVASVCTERGCECGGERRACDAAAGERCCFEDVPPLPVSRRFCFDLDEDADHCGQCGRRCPAGARCEDGVCTFGSTPCATRCLEAQVCCDGECCLDAQCAGGTSCNRSGAP